jgi:hypothetical protein
VDGAVAKATAGRGGLAVGLPFGRRVEVLAEAFLDRDGVLRDDDPLEVTLAITTPVVGLLQFYFGDRMDMPEDDFRALCTRTTGRVLNGLIA